MNRVRSSVATLEPSVISRPRPSAPRSSRSCAGDRYRGRAAVVPSAGPLLLTPVWWRAVRAHDATKGAKFRTLRSEPTTPRVPPKTPSEPMLTRVPTRVSDLSVPKNRCAAAWAR
jgi:hypothetical protein